MAKKSISEKRAEREQAENQVLRRVFNVFLLGLAAEVYLFVVYRSVTGSIESMLMCYQTVLPILTWLGLAMLVGGAAVGYVKRADRKLLVPMAWTACTGLFLGLSGLIMTTFSNDHRGVTTMCVLVPILAVLGLVYLLYQHECFLCTISLSGALFAVWTMGSAANSMSWRVPVTVGLVVAAALLAVFAALTHKAQQSEGKLGKVRLFPVECDYRVIYGVLAVAFVCVLAAMVLPSFSYYLMWVLGIALFAELVLYTTKLM